MSLQNWLRIGSLNNTSLSLSRSFKHKHTHTHTHAWIHTLIYTTTSILPVHVWTVKHMSAPHSNRVYTLICCLHVRQHLRPLAECQCTSVPVLFFHGNQSEFTINKIRYTVLLKHQRKRVLWKRGGSCDSWIYHLGFCGILPQSMTVVMSSPGCDVTTGSKGFQSESHFLRFDWWTTYGKVIRTFSIKLAAFLGQDRKLIIIIIYTWYYLWKA